MKRNLFILLCLALCLSTVFVSCELGQGNTPDESEQGSESADLSDSDTESESKTDEREKIEAVKNGVAAFTIVYGENGNSDAADKLAQGLNRKTGVIFRISKTIKSDMGSKIFVGLHDGAEGIYELYADQISYNGYGAAYKDGDIYICGYNADAVTTAVTKFLGEFTNDCIVKNDSGKTENAYFGEKMFFVSNPLYSESAPQINGEPISNYVITVGTAPEGYTGTIANGVASRLGNASGSYVRVLSSSSSDKKIEFKHNEALDMFEYVMTKNGNGFKIEVGGVCAAYAAFDRLPEFAEASATTETGNAENTLLAGIPFEKEKGTDIRAMSVNILGSGQEEIASQCQTDLRALIMAEYITALAPDSVGLQEYYGVYEGYFMDILGEKYEEFTFGKSGGLMISTIYRKDKYSVKDWGMKSLKVSGGQDYYFTWLLLENKTTGDTYIHANLHLEYRSDALRLEQAAMIQPEIDSIMAEYGDAVFVMSGDYNARLNDAPAIFETMAGENHLSSAALVAPEGKNDSNKKSYVGLCVDGGNATGQPIDHIFVNTYTTEVLLHKIIADSVICHASDHRPVLVDVAAKSAQ